VLTSTRGPTGCSPRATDPQPTAAPRQPGLVVRGLRWGVALAVRGVLRSYNRLTIVGRENLPADGPFVLVANHSSHLDVLCLLAAIPLGELPRSYPTASDAKK
jgi:1-acyl-sn-glycerol-3-phosphate acyltransferase